MAASAHESECAECRRSCRTTGRRERLGKNNLECIPYEAPLGHEPFRRDGEGLPDEECIEERKEEAYEFRIDA